MNGTVNDLKRRIEELEGQLADSVSQQEHERITEERHRQANLFARLRGAMGWQVHEPNELVDAAMDLRTQRDRYRAALERLQAWASAYPISVFPEPDFGEVHRVLRSAGISLDSVSASNMRHVITQVETIIEEAMGDDA